MPFLGIDQSLTGTGLCLLSDDGVPLHLETVDPGKRRGAERLLYVKSRVVDLLGRGVLFVSQEGYAYNSVSRQHALGEIGGVLRLVVHENNVPSAVVPPALLKKFATGVPSADKDAMVRAAKEEGADVLDDNQADAFFLAMISRHLHTGMPSARRARLEVLHRLRNPRPKTKRRVRRLVKNTL